MLSSQFQTVVLAGPGSRLEPFTSSSFSVHAPVSTTPTQASPTSRTLPKALLPVANESILDHLVVFVEKANLKDVLLLAPRSQSSALRAHLDLRRSLSPIDAASPDGQSARIDLHCYNDDYDQDATTIQPRGTAGVLVWAMSKGLLKTDFILLPCDLFYQPANVSAPSLQSLLDHHRTHANLVTCLFYSRDAAGEDVSKLGPDASPLLLATLSNQGHLLDAKDLEDFEGDSVEFRSKVFLKYPRLSVTTKLLPAHVYVCSNPVLQVLSRYPNVEYASFKEDIVPLLAKSQWQDGLLDKILLKEPKITLPPSSSSTANHSTQQQQQQLQQQQLQQLQLHPQQQQQQQNLQHHPHHHNEFSSSSFGWQSKSHTQTVPNPVKTTFAPQPIPQLTALPSSSSQALSPQENLSHNNNNNNSNTITTTATANTTAIPTPNTTTDSPPRSHRGNTNQRSSIATRSRKTTIDGNSDDDNNNNKDHFSSFLKSRRRIGVVTWTPSDGIITRVNHIDSLKYANAAVAQERAKAAAGGVGVAGKRGGGGGPGGGPGGSGGNQISVDSIVDTETVKIGERASIKKSIIARNCVIGNMAKISNCVLMEGVTVAESVKLDNCVVGPAANIHERTNLKDCLVEGYYTVEREANYKGETLAGNEQDDDDDDIDI